MRRVRFGLHRLEFFIELLRSSMQTASFPNLSATKRSCALEMPRCHSRYAGSCSFVTMSSIRTVIGTFALEARVLLGRSWLGSFQRLLDWCWTYTASSSSFFSSSGMCVASQVLTHSRPRGTSAEIRKY